MKLIDCSCSGVNESLSPSATRYSPLLNEGQEKSSSTYFKYNSGIINNVSNLIRYCNRKEIMPVIKKKLIFLIVIFLNFNLINSLCLNTPYLPSINYPRFFGLEYAQQKLRIQLVKSA